MAPSHAIVLATGPVQIVAWIAACVIWRSVWLAIKVGVTGAPPFGFAAVRLAVALTVLLPLAWSRQPLTVLTSAEVRFMAETGALLLGLNYAFVYWGSQYVSSGLTATLQALTPVFGIIVARLLAPDERTTPAQMGLLARMPARQVLMMSVVEPLLAVALGAVVLGERITPLPGVGGLMIVAAAYFTLRAEA